MDKNVIMMQRKSWEYLITRSRMEILKKYIYEN